MRETHRLTWAIAALVFLAAIAAAATAAADTVPFYERRLTDTPSGAYGLAVWGTNVVWYELRGGNYDVYLHDLATGIERRLTTNSSEQQNPDIYGTSVVYEDYRNGNGDIYLYDLATGVERQLTTHGDDQEYPRIWGTNVVYMDDRTGNYDVYLYDLTTGVERRLTTNAETQDYPSIWGTNVVWEDNRNGIYDIYRYDLATGIESRVTTNASSQYYPDICGTSIVYEDNRNGNFDIYLYDLATGVERRLTTHGSYQHAPAIWGNKVVYHDSRSGNLDIWLCDIVSGREWQLTTNGQSQESANIWGTTVVYEDYRHGNTEAFAGEILEPHISLAGPSVVGYGAAGVFSGSLTSVTGIPIAGRGMRLETSYDGGWTWNPVAAIATDALGRFAMSTPGIASTVMVRAAFDGDATYLSARTSQRMLTSNVWLTRVSASRYGTRAYRLTGYLKPRHAAGAAPVRITRWRYVRGKWRSYGSSWAKVSDYNGYSKYSMKYKFPYAGRWRLQAYHPTDAENAATKSAYSYVTVR